MNDRFLIVMLRTLYSTIPDRRCLPKRKTREKIENEKKKGAQKKIVNNRFDLIRDALLFELSRTDLFAFNGLFNHF